MLQNPQVIPRALNFSPEEISILRRLIQDELVKIKAQVMETSDGRTVAEAEEILFKFKHTQSLLERFLGQTQ